MSTVWLERLALLGALSALVLALFWPHVGPKIFLPCIQKFLINPLSAIIKRQVINIDEYPREQSTAIKRDHPKFSGGSLRRMTSDKESIYSAYRSLEGFGQSPLASGPSFSMRIPSIVPTNRAGHLNHRHLSQQAGGGGAGAGQSSTMSLTIFTATMMALIVYTLMKMLTSRFSGYNNNTTNSGRVNRCGPASCWSTPSDHNNRANMETRDLRQDRRRRFARLSRDERARELILHHGGRNVSSAIRFLVSELEKQKHLLFKNLSDNTDLICDCDCSCHADDTRTDPDKPIFRELESLDEGGCKLEQLGMATSLRAPTESTNTISK